jgi:hypothetical protein
MAGARSPRLSRSTVLTVVLVFLAVGAIIVALHLIPRAQRPTLGPRGGAVSSSGRP